MNGFAAFFEAKLTEREMQIEAEREAQEEARRQAKKRADEMTKPFRVMYAAVRQHAASDLKKKSVAYEDNLAPYDMFADRQGFHQTFLLSFKSPKCAELRSYIYGFKITGSGIVEGFFEKPGLSRTIREPVFAKNMDELAVSDIEKIVCAAIKNLIKNI